MEFSEFLRRNRWCLQKEVLELLILDGEKHEDVVKRVTYSTSILNDEGQHIGAYTTEVKSLTMRSSVSSNVYYEIVFTSNGRDKKVFINLWKENPESKYACVYKNGRVLRWGSWAVELMQTLPDLIAKLGRNTVDSEVVLATEALHGQDSKHGEFSAIETELALNWSDEGPSAEEIYDKDRSGVPLDFLE